jgi:carboxyl-terminal processing protease
VAPLELDDLVLAIDGVATAGLSVEQVEQLARVEPAPGANGERSVVVLRQGEEAPRELVVATTADDDETTGELDQAAAPARKTAQADELGLDFVPYGRGNAAVVSIHYVGDDLGDRLAAIVAELAAAHTPPLGILLDLRGNGGGSTDGAAAALGVFLPGAPAYPLLQRGQVTEVLVAPAPAAASRWRGPVAALVDGDTASAAEMIAGGLARYERGPLAGQRTFGKGCVQEYFRDHAGGGVLRLTTRLYALPDGSPVQRRGLLPELLVGHDGPSDSEADLPGSLEPMTGPDVRIAGMTGPPWPSHGGRVGPCPDGAICQTLRKVAQNAQLARRVEPSSRKRRAPKTPAAASR